METSPLKSHNHGNNFKIKFQIRIKRFGVLFSNIHITGRKRIQNNDQPHAVDRCNQKLRITKNQRFKPFKTTLQIMMELIKYRYYWDQFNLELYIQYLEQKLIKEQQKNTNNGNTKNQTIN